jgi:hypothetical protein
MVDILLTETLMKIMDDKGLGIYNAAKLMNQWSSNIMRNLEQEAREKEYVILT